ncbi:MAG: 3-hydroxyacyl-ACP dehydratase FabZ [Pseudomonadota bacterium]
MESNIDIQKIIEVMPHRYPFLLVDRVLEIVEGEKIVALKNVTINEPFFQGHFPGMPIMPGVLIVEAMAQAGGVLFLATMPQEKKDHIFYFMGMDKVRFRKPVTPGDQLIFEVSILRKRSKALKMAATASVDNKKVAEAELLATIGEKP